MNLSIYYLVTKTMGCYALGGYKNMVTKKERKRGYKTIEKDLVTKREREVTKSNGFNFLLHLNEYSEATNCPHVTGHGKRGKCLNRTTAFDGRHLSVDAYNLVTKSHCITLRQ